MIEPGSDLALAILVASGVMLYGLFWWLVGGMPPLARWLTRILVTVALAVPIALSFHFGHEKQVARGPTASAPGEPPGQPATKRHYRSARPPSAETSAPAPSTPMPPPPVGSAPPPPPVASAPPPAPATPPPASESRPEPPVVAASPPPPSTTPSPADRPVLRAPAPVPRADDGTIAEKRDMPRSAAPPVPAGGSAPPDPGWVSVPILYGTDRNRRADEPSKIVYGSDRARQLEIGVAEVTIPKSHQVPNIERPWAIKIPYLDITLYQETEDPKRHFTIKEMKVLTAAEFVARARQRLALSSRFKDHALLFVHGYNNGFDHALFRTAQIAYDIDFDGLPMMYSWPSGGGYTSYAYDRDSAVQSEPHMRRFLDLAIRETGAKAVSIIAHSMGALPLLQVLRDLQRTLPPGVTLSQIVLAAPDIDRDVFANLAGEIKGVARGMTLYAAGNDTALMVSRQVAGGVPRAGEVPAEGPLVLPDIDTIDVTSANTEVLSARHNHYAQSKDLLEDIGKLLLTNMRPPSQRSSRYEIVTTPAGNYWRYPPR